MIMRFNGSLHVLGVVCGALQCAHCMLLHATSCLQEHFMSVLAGPEDVAGQKPPFRKSLVGALADLPQHCLDDVAGYKVGGRQ